MERIIKNAFKNLLNTDVKVFKGLFDDDTDNQEAYSIYYTNGADKTDENYKKFSPDIEIFKLKDSEYIYSICVQTSYGSYWQPPEWDYVESKKTYKSIKDALVGLVEETFKLKIEDFLMAEEEREFAEYEKTIDLTNLK